MPFDVMTEETKGLTEEEKAVMKKLGWSVFNNKVSKKVSRRKK